MIEKAYAKINLCLNTVGKREDGYTELQMIMAPIDFYDTLEVKRSHQTTLVINKSFLPVNEKNTVIKAINAMKRHYDIDGEFECHLIKHIPSQAGLGGGSADAAAMIRILNRMMRLDLSVEEMCAIGKEVGADVPFCVQNQIALVEGIGEIITPFECTTDFSIFLVKPRVGASTAEVFHLVNFETVAHPDCGKMQEALQQNNYEAILQSLGNSLEEATFSLIPELQDIKQELLDFGFDGALMSGSGSTIFGITKDKSILKDAQHHFQKKGYFTRTTRIMDNAF